MSGLGKLILHFNTPEMTELLCQMVPGAIVIDNGSTLFPYAGGNRCIRQENLGFTKGWNQAIKSVWDEFDSFWLMNSDIEITPENVERVEILSGLTWFFTPAYNCWMKHCQPQDQGGLEETFIMEFTAPVISKKVFEQIGFFDPLFAKGYGVEFDFCYRAKQAGIVMFVDHASRFYHLGQQTISQHEGILRYSSIANRELVTGLAYKYGPDYGALVFNGLNIKTDLDMKIAIYTTIFGNYDTLKEFPRQEVGADYYIVTDNPEIKAEGWTTVVPDFPRWDLSARMRAKFFKLFPWELPELRGYQITIYIDASIQVTSANFVATCVKNLAHDFLLFRHPQRRCIYEEGKASKELIKYDNEPIDVQLDFYRTFHPANAGLYAGGVLIRRNTETMRKIMADWWFEIIKYSYQDQLSLPVVLQLNHYIPDVFVENQYKNSFFKVKWHDDEKTNDANCNELHEVQPEFTVLMPVWKTPIDKLNKAICSIINQSYRDFELVIVNDNNYDLELINVLKYWQTFPGVTIVATTENKGLAHTLDIGIEAAQGKYIVRMDSDDVADSGLLQAHHDFFTEHPIVAICGVQLNLMKYDSIQSVTNHPAIVTKKSALAPNIFWLVNHPGVCYRRDVVLSLGGYGNTPAQMPEDYALWCKFLKAGYEIYNNPLVLIDYTLGDGSQIGQDRKGKSWKEFLIKEKKGLK
jgi:GT2 family glycosyltransferase